MNIQINQMSFIFCYKIVIYLFFITAPPPHILYWASRQGVLEHPQHLYFPR